MTFNRSHTHCLKDTDIFLIKHINEGSSEKVKSAKSRTNPRNSDCSIWYDDCDLCFYDIGTSNSSGDEQNFTINNSKKQNKIQKTGSVKKISLRRDLVKSSPCLDYCNFGYTQGAHEATDDSRIHKKKLLKQKLSYRNIQDDIDYIPVKLISSEKTLPFKVNEKMKMSNARQNFNARSPERKVNSWGRILKEQNGTTKDLKKSVSAAPQNSKLKNPTTVARNQVNSQIKEKHANYDVSVQQTKAAKNKQVVKDNYPVPVMRKKSSHHTLRFEPPAHQSEYSSGSSTSITGESIMLVDRSAQCSTTNLEGLDPSSWCNNFNDINQAGDSGLAFLNPVRTLNFLVRELRGKVSEGSEDDNMSRIIRDMESTIARLTKTPSCTPGGGGGASNSIKENWNTIISEDDLKFVLELLQNSPHIVKITETEKNTAELQHKLEGTCTKLEELCKLMEKTTCHKLREDKQRLISEINMKNEELEAAAAREKRHEQIIIELKKKNEEQSKQIAALKENQSKAAALNAIVNDQLQDTEKKYQQVVTEMQFLILEKEKNLVLMKCKDQDIQEMRKNLEEIKSLVVQHLTSFQLESTNSGTALCKDNKVDFDDMTLISTLSATVLHKDIKEIKNDLPMCSSPAETLSPSPEDDESWRKISNVPMTAPDCPLPPSLLLEEQPMNLTDVQTPLQHQSSKTVCLKESLKNLFEEMKRQTKLGKNISVHNLINLDDPLNMCNWSELDFSDEDVHSITMCGISGSDTNLSK